MYISTYICILLGSIILMRRNYNLKSGKRFCSQAFPFSTKVSGNRCFGFNTNGSLDFGQLRFSMITLLGGSLRTLMGHFISLVSVFAFVCPLASSVVLTLFTFFYFIS